MKRTTYILGDKNSLRKITEGDGVFKLYWPHNGSWRQEKDAIFPVPPSRIYDVYDKHQKNFKTISSRKAAIILKLRLYGEQLEK